MKKELALILSAVLFFGCSGGPDVEIPEHSRGLENLTIYDPDTEPAMNIEFIRETGFGSTDEVTLGRILMLSVDSYDRVYISDTMQGQIFIFNPDGEYHSTFGRRGEGPGEFRSFSNIWDHSDTLYVFDSGQQWINVFTMPDETGSPPVFIRTVDIIAENWDEVVEPEYSNPSVHSIRSDGSLLLRTASPVGPDGSNSESNGFLQYHIFQMHDDHVTDAIFQQERSKTIRLTFASYAPTFFGHSMMALSRDNRIVSAWSEDFLIRVHDPDGTYIRSFYYPVEKPALTREDALDGITMESLLQALQTVDLPEAWPVMRSMLIDDENRIWARIRTEDSETDEWWLLENTGELISKFTWPRGQSIQIVKNGYAYTRETDEMGVVSFVRYRIEVEEAD